MYPISTHVTQAIMQDRLRQAEHHQMIASLRDTKRGRIRWVSRTSGSRLVARQPRTLAAR